MGASSLRNAPSRSPANGLVAEPDGSRSSTSEDGRRHDRITARHGRHRDPAPGGPRPGLPADRRVTGPNTVDTRCRCEQIPTRSFRPRRFFGGPIPAERCEPRIGEASLSPRQSAGLRDGPGRPPTGATFGPLPDPCSSRSAWPAPFVKSRLITKLLGQENYKLTRHQNHKGRETEAVGIAAATFSAYLAGKTRAAPASPLEGFRLIFGRLSEHVRNPPGTPKTVSWLSPRILCQRIRPAREPWALPQSW